jgi:uncharacterized protein YybS (DUF2232 family)
LKLLLIFSLFLSAALIPVIGFFFLCTLPQLVLVVTFLNNPKTALTALTFPLVVICIILVGLQFTLPALTIAVMGLAGIVMTTAARKSKNDAIEPVVLLPSLVILAAVTLYFIFAAHERSITPWQLVERTVTQAVELNISAYSRLPISQEEMKALVENKASIIHVFVQVFPALCIATVLLLIWLNLLSSKRILLKSGRLPLSWRNLTAWKAPAWLIWIFLASGGLMLVPDAQAKFAGVNAFLSIAFVYLLQGFAIVSFFFQQKGISPFLRGLFYFFVAIQQILMVAIALLGFFDIWIDFRKYFRNSPAAGE